MMTVRFPDGTSVQYNTAMLAQRYDDGGYTDLYTKNGGNWIAQVPNSALIEVHPACRVYNAVRSTELAEMQAELRLLKKAVNKLSRKS